MAKDEPIPDAAPVTIAKPEMSKETVITRERFQRRRPKIQRKDVRMCLNGSKEKEQWCFSWFQVPSYCTFGALASGDCLVMQILFC